MAFIFTDYYDYRYNKLQDIHFSHHLTDTFLKEIYKSLESNLNNLDGVIFLLEDNCFLVNQTFHYLSTKIKLPTYFYPSNESLTDFITKCINLQKAGELNAS